MREKAWSTPRVTIHWRPEISQLGMQFVQKWLRKLPYTLYKSCRGMQDLPLWYMSLWALQFIFLSKCWSNCAKPNLNSPWNAPARDVAGTPCLPAAVPRRTCTPATSGLSAAPWLLCVTLMSVLAGATRHSPTRRTAPPPYTIGCLPLHVATPLRPCHAHAATPLLTTVVTPSPRRTRLYKRPTPLQSSTSAAQSFFSCPPWPPVGELLPPVASISFRPRLSLPTSPRSPTETLPAVGLSIGSANSPEQTVPWTQTPWHRRALSLEHLPPPPTPQIKFLGPRESYHVLKFK
jgi:hypothetical protein